MSETISIELSKFFALIVAGFCVALASCRDEPRPAPVQRLATDVYVTIGEHRLVMPFAALEDYAYRGASFSFDGKGDAKRAEEAAENLLRDASDAYKPRAFHILSVVVTTYGSSGVDMRLRGVCPLLTRTWSRSVCDNSSAAVRLALPHNGFTFVDLRELPKTGGRNPSSCESKEEGPLLMPEPVAQATIICRAMSMDGVHYRAAVRIDQHLGAVWTVWGDGSGGETADQMARREGEAIVSFVRNALGADENFPALERDMHRLIPTRSK